LKISSRISRRGGGLPGTSLLRPAIATGTWSWHRLRIPFENGEMIWSALCRVKAVWFHRWGQLCETARVAVDMHCKERASYEQAD
jgi:hypothetical protein